MDMEEAWLITLTRGVWSNDGVCPVCFVPHDKQHDVKKHWPRRNTKHAQEVYKQALSLANQPRKLGKSEELLKKYGMVLMPVRHHLFCLTMSSLFCAVCALEHCELRSLSGHLMGSTPL